MTGVIATYLHLDAPGEGTRFPAAGRDSSAPETQAVYWRSVVVFFASSLRQDPDSRHVLFTNAPRCPVVDGVDVHAWLASRGVEIVALPMTFRTPKSFAESWGCVFYLYDVVRWVSEHAADDEAYLLLDCDVVWVRSAAPLITAVSEQHAASYTYVYDEEWIINGLSRTDMKGLFEEMDGAPLDHVPAYSCGEFLGLDRRGARELSGLARATFQTTLERFEQGRSHFNEEAHMMSYLFHKLGYPQGTANGSIKRIWTGSDFNNVEPSDQDLTIWHVPSEKRSGLARLFEAASTPDSTFWRVALGDPFRRYVGRRVGIPRRTWFDRKLVGLERRTLSTRRAAKDRARAH